MSNKNSYGAILAQLVDTIEKAAYLKYNYFSKAHPNKDLQGKLFKFLDKDKVQLLKTKEMIQVTDKDLRDQSGKKLYFPADQGWNRFTK